MPRLSDSMIEGTIVRWLKEVGEEVTAGEELVAIETDKAEAIYEADLTGRLSAILVDDGSLVVVGAPIAEIEPTGGAPAETGRTESVRTAKGRVERFELSRAEQAYARRVAESKAIVPHLYLSARINLGAILALLDSSDGAQTTVDAFIRACGLGLRRHRRLNSRYLDGALEIFERANVALMVPFDGVPAFATISDADTKTAAQIGLERRLIEADAAAGRLRSPQLAGATFSLSVLTEGHRGGFVAAVNPPQAAALSIGQSFKAAHLCDDRTVMSTVADLSLACDNRVVDPTGASAFLATICDLLEKPRELRL